MPQIDWSYHRRGWTTCGKTQEFLAQWNLAAAVQVDAKKEPHGEAESLALAAQAEEIYAAKGQKVVFYNLRRDRPTPEQLKRVLLGPTGNLRAPTLRLGGILVVGFNEEMYQKLLLGKRK